METEFEPIHEDMRKKTEELKTPKIWGLQKAASALTKMDGKKKKTDIGNRRETLANIVKHDVELVLGGGKAEILQALIEELTKKLAKKNLNFQL